MNHFVDHGIWQQSHRPKKSGFLRRKVFRHRPIGESKCFSCQENPTVDSHREARESTHDAVDVRDLDRRIQPLQSPIEMADLSLEFAKSIDLETNRSIEGVVTRNERSECLRVSQRRSREFSKSA
ncbi:MAG: hypothetical protein CME26_15640 [Gemmatimonadetes bacterium]|nr:hypothetical protein [Gemmatimonadota bacterium]